MTDNPKPRRLSETVVPGVDYEDKQKIAAVLDREVVLTGFERTKGSKEFALVNAETGEIVIKDYWNISIEDDGKLITFSTGAIPIGKVLTSLQSKIEAGIAELPLLVTFHKEGRTYTIS